MKVDSKVYLSEYIPSDPFGEHFFPDLGQMMDLNICTSIIRSLKEIKVYGDRDFLLEKRLTEGLVFFL